MTKERAQGITLIKLSKIYVFAVASIATVLFNTASANDVKILAADFRGNDNNHWSVSVTLKHADTGWDHYADKWRVVDGDGNILGGRVLHHPHVGEQPFTRGLRGVVVPEGITQVYIEAHDTVHGWTPNRLTVDLSKARDGHLRVKP